MINGATCVQDCLRLSNQNSSVRFVGSRARGLVLAFTALFILGGAVQVQAQEDPWFGRDKLKHFGASAAISAGGSALGAALFESEEAAAGFGVVLSLGAGGLKEWSDSRGDGSASWRDMAWNVIGTSVGVGLVYLIRRL